MSATDHLQPDPADPTDPTVPTDATWRPPALVVGAAVLSGAAGLVHAVAAGNHADDRTMVWLFALSAIVQVGWAAIVLLRPSRPVLTVGALMNVGLVLVWAITRTSGIPLVDALAEPESVGLQDLSAAVLAAASAACAVGVLIGVGTNRAIHPILVTGLGSLAVVTLVGGMVAPHEHGAAHDHGEVATADHDTVEHGHDTVAHDHDDGSGDQLSTLATDAVFVGADTGGLTDDQLQVAKDLVEQTRTAVAASFTDEASVVAAGYVSIGDGRRRTGVSYEHFINPEYLLDDHQLDPEHVESLVFEVSNGTKRLTTAMYLLDRGQTMADVPDIAGDLTMWHDHQNLCWDPSGSRLSGVVVDGSCVPSGTLRPTPPMMHVWLSDNPCGPFAGVEGHGADDTAACAHEHSH